MAIQAAEENAAKTKRLQKVKEALEKANFANEQDANENVLYPKYTYDEYLRMDIERDEDKPDPTLFMEVGYDPRKKYKF